MTGHYVQANITYADRTFGSASTTFDIRDSVAFEHGVALDNSLDSSASTQKLWNDYAAACGTPDFFRRYMTPSQSTLANFPSSWAQAVTMMGELPDWATRGTAWSFRPDCAAFAAGQYDSKFKACLNGYTGKKLRVMLWHEADAQVRQGNLNRVDWLNAMDHAATLFDTYLWENVELWTCVTGYMWDPASGSNPNDYVTPGVDGYCADTYQDPSARHDGTAWKTPDELLDGYVAFCNAHAYRKGWMEIGCQPDFNNLNRRPNWLTDAVN